MAIVYFRRIGSSCVMQRLGRFSLRKIYWNSKSRAMFWVFPRFCKCLKGKLSNRLSSELQIIDDIPWSFPRHHYHHCFLFENRSKFCIIHLQLEMAKITSGGFAVRRISSSSKASGRRLAHWFSRVSMSRLLWWGTTSEGRWLRHFHGSWDDSYTTEHRFPSSTNVATSVKLMGIISQYSTSFVM